MPQFLGGWYVHAAVPIPIVQPDGVTCAYSIYGEDGSKTSMHDWHIQGGPTRYLTKILLIYFTFKL